MSNEKNDADTAGSGSTGDGISFSTVLQSELDAISNRRDALRRRRERHSSEPKPASAVSSPMAELDALAPPPIKSISKTAKQWGKSRAQTKHYHPVKEKPAASMADKIKSIAPDAQSQNLEPPPASAPARQTIDTSKPTLEEIQEQALEMDLCGIAISGGGIRAATFGLGVLQGLAKAKLLPRFDYISTVSGGGYIGSFLSAWVQRSCLFEVQDELALGADQTLTTARSEVQPKPVEHLRKYSNYLAPRPGILTYDGWLLVAIYLRNLILNQVALLLVAFAIFALVRGVVEVFSMISNNHQILDFLNLSMPPLFKQLTLAFGFMASMVFAVVAMSRFYQICTGEGNKNPSLKSIWLVGTATSLTAFFGSIACWRQEVLAVLVISMIGFGMLGIFCRNDSKEAPWGFASGAVAGLLAGLLALAVFKYIPMNVAGLATFGVPIVLFVFVIGEMLFVGLSGKKLEEMEREWWSALNSRLMLFGVAWIALFSIAVYGPCLFHIIVSYARSWALTVSLASIGWVGSILSGLLAAQSAQTGSRSGANSWTGKALNIVVAATPMLFLVTVFFIVSILWTWITYDIYALASGSEIGFWNRVNHASPQVFLSDLETFKFLGGWIPVLFAYVLAVPVLYCVSWAFTCLIGVNRFSLQNMYANRLTRCYLGASKTRQPNLLTNFDGNDDLPMSELCRAEYLYTVEKHFRYGPIHLVNGALNLNDSPNESQLATQDRKAESFVFSPFASGSNTTKYCHTKDLADDLKLGNALAVSGAAASPNMGYHSAPAITALLTMFNVRLGAWFGNPSNKDTRPKTEPFDGLHLLLSEMFGTGAKDDYVYLSDGGHFENMGVYELIRRRCRYIVAVDADAAPNFHENIGRVVRMARIDFDVRIELDSSPITPNEDGNCEAHVVVGRIHYDNVHEPDRTRSENDPGFDHDNNQGIIVWISLGMTGDEPEDILNYRAMNKTGFPYQSTSDQFFDENQFESYRALGAHAVDSMLKDLNFPDPDSISNSDPDHPARLRRTSRPELKSASQLDSSCDPMFASLATRSIVGFKEGEQRRQARRNQLSNREFFDTIHGHWLPRPKKFLKEYAGLNERYMETLEKLRTEASLERLANELYGFEDRKERLPDTIPLAESLMVAQMMTLLENVWFALDLEHHYLHPVHRGWKGVFDNWLESPTVKHCWNKMKTAGHSDPGLRQEFSPVFQQFVSKLASLKNGQKV